MQSDKETINFLVQIENKTNNVNSHWETGCNRTDVVRACETDKLLPTQEPSVLSSQVLLEVLI